MIRKYEIILEFGIRFEEDWKCLIEIDESATLEDLHFAIQSAVGFDNDHLYGFFLDRTWRSFKRDWVSQDSNGLDIPEHLKLSSFYPLPKYKRLFYLFDFGDDWTFRVSRKRNSPQPPEEGIKYPRVIETSGKAPEQYANWDEDEWE